MPSKKAFFLYIFVTGAVIVFEAGYVQANYALKPGIPIAIIYDLKTSDETVNLVDLALKSMNTKIKYGRSRWSIEVSQIDTENTQLLIQTICKHMSRGVLAIFGSTNLASFEIVKSLTNKYNIPFISWSFFFQDNQNILRALQSRNDLTKHSLLKNETVISPVNNNIKQQKRDLNFKPTRTDYEYSYPYEYETKNYNNGIEYLKNMKKELATKTEEKQIYLRPLISDILIEMVRYYRWESVYFVYNHEHGELNLAALMQFQLDNQKHMIPDLLNNIHVRKLTHVKNARGMLRVINAGSTDNRNNKNITIIFDLDTRENYRTILNQLKDLGMTDDRYHYVLTYPGVNEINLNDFKYGGVVITGLSMIDYYSINTIKIVSDLIEKDKPLNKISLIPYEAAIIIDGLSYFIMKIDDIIGPDANRLFGMDGVRLDKNRIFINGKNGIQCIMGLNSTEKWQLGSFILNQIKMDDNQIYEGLTGPISFDQNGNRKNVKIGIYNLELNSRLNKVGFYSTEFGLKMNEKKASNKLKANISRKKKIVISVFDEPFFMLRKPEEGKNFTGNDQYIGYCVDLTKKLAEILNFNFEIRPVKDKKFGAQDSQGRWNGMVGELVRHEADFAVAPLTISTQRERAIEFSMPFMNIGISIMISKPKKEKPGVFSFMTPLDKSVWLGIIMGYLTVSIVMYLVTRVSPFEWTQDSDGHFNNDFHLQNSLWFNLSALLQQGADFSPKSPSARLIAGVWWFFTLILISSYTANLAAFLTVENMVNPINSAEDLVKQTEIKFGSLGDGATSAFFKNSKVKTYQEMWRFMNSWGPEVFVKSNLEGLQKVRNSSGKYAYLLESSVNEYLNERKPCNTIKVGHNLDSKGYGIATPINSELSEPINLAILQLSEDGYLTELKSKWWYDRSECAGSASSSDSSKTPLNLVNVTGVFYILITFLIMSVLIASLELVYKANLQSKKDKILLSHAIKSRIRLSISGFDMRGLESKSNSLVSVNDQSAINQKSKSNRDKFPTKISPKKAVNEVKEKRSTAI